MAGSRLSSVLIVLALAGLAGMLVLIVPALRTSGGVIDVRLPETAAATPADGQMKVYVSGAVLRPGVYSVRPGDRIGDLIEAAGGPLEEADLTNVNFARRLRDEDHVTVPRPGDPPVAAPASGASASERINLNTATPATLELLPGIGPARAQRITESRLKDGPFAAATDLVQRRLVPQSVFDALKDEVEVRP